MAIRMLRVPQMITVVWIFTIIFSGLLMGIWYIFQPAFTYTTIVLDQVIYNMNQNRTETDRIVTFLKLGINVSIPIMIVGLWLWAIISSQRKDWRGYEEGYSYA